MIERLIHILCLVATLVCVTLVAYQNTRIAAMLAQQTELIVRTRR